MVFEETDKRTGKKHIAGSKYWPDGTRFRPRLSNRTLAKKFAPSHASQRVIEGAAPGGRGNGRFS